MPSTSQTDSLGISRRALLASISTGVVGSLAGCSGRLPGTDPVRLDTEKTVATDDDPVLLWRYPSREDEEEGIGYAAVELTRIRRDNSHPSALDLTFNSTVGGIASSEPYRGYRADWFRFRIWPPTTYEGRLDHRVRVEPPGQWHGFSLYYDIRGTIRHTVIELRDVDTQGTIIIPAVFDPSMNGLPDHLHCAFTVRASRPGLLGRSIRVSDTGKLPLKEA
mgnify:CR=1 FL=1